MPANVGLLLTYNEADVIEEWLAVTAPHVDAILALDGSSDGTTEVLRGHPKVTFLLRDQDVASGQRVRDWHRQALLEAARERYGPGNWITLLHADEFFHDDPRDAIAAATREGASIVNWASMQFFLHPNDALHHPGVAGVVERVRWYSPLWIEVRQFRDRPGARYREGEHGRVLPRGTGWRPYSRLPVLRHYPYRSPAQVLGKRADAGLSASDFTRVYRETAGPAYRTARRFQGDFGEWELARQPHIALSWLRWRRLMRP
ncbi:MAG TPA: glycosyltransferase family 2 protein [Deinococcales bacterium]|nr:glycosyltransferase family 2 protein [Deinococcales bacterium]